ncbi:hypothetical protein ACOME3_002766 [Neoechinorhynchus agilis]
MLFTRLYRPMTLRLSPYCNRIRSCLVATAAKDQLYSEVRLELEGHDVCVLDSYQKYIELTSNELDLKIEQIERPLRFIERWSILKSKFGHKKHFKQYEMRTYFRTITLSNLTGSTLSTFLEYIQRNVPEGVMMIVRKTEMQPLSDDILNDIHKRVTSGQNT